MKNQKKLSERTSARIVLLNEKNELFLLKYHTSNEEFWLTPGGQVEAGEDIFSAAKRELFEETGLSGNDVAFTLPHSWYCEGVYTVRGEPVLFKEYFFLARVHNKPINTVHFNESEKSEIIGGQWWDLRAFIKSGKMFYPYTLLQALEPVVYDGVAPKETVVLQR